MPCYAALCYAMLGYAMMCCAALCCATLCYAMLCWAMLKLGETKMNGASLGEPRGGCWGNRPGRFPLPGPFSLQGKNPSRHSLGREQRWWIETGLYSWGAKVVLWRGGPRIVSSDRRISVSSELSPPLPCLPSPSPLL
eukprot:4554602-Pyramimonas_sp.AAC.1